MDKKLTLLFLILVSFLSIGWHSKDAAMIKAIRNGNIVEVQLLLDQGVNPNLKLDHNQTLLMYAAGKGNLSIAKLLLENGAELTAVDSKGRTALLIAREEIQVEMVKLLNSWNKAAPKPISTAVPTIEENLPVKSVISTAPVQTPTTEQLPSEASVSTIKVASTVTPSPDIKTSSTPEITPTPAKVDDDKLVMTFFDFNKTNLKTEEVEKLKSFLSFLKNHPKHYIILGGHADEVGSSKYSLFLTRQRADKIKKYLIETGISEDRIIIYTYGQDHPLKRGHDEASWAFNRRVDILSSDTILSAEEMLSKTINIDSPR